MKDFFSQRDPEAEERFRSFLEEKAHRCKPCSSMLHVNISRHCPAVLPKYVILPRQESCKAGEGARLAAGNLQGCAPDPGKLFKASPVG